MVTSWIKVFRLKRKRKVMFRDAKFPSFTRCAYCHEGRDESIARRIENRKVPEDVTTSLGRGLVFTNGKGDISCSTHAFTRYLFCMETKALRTCQSTFERVAN